MTKKQKITNTGNHKRKKKKKMTTGEENRTVLTATILQFTALMNNFPLYCVTWNESQDTAEKHQNMANM